MKLRQTVGIIMGANIGTTVTAQLLRLGDISSDNFLLLLLKPATLGPILAVVGIIFDMFLHPGVAIKRSSARSFWVWAFSLSA